jgi:hypothetical protein
VRTRLIVFVIRGMMKIKMSDQVEEEVEEECKKYSFLR